MKKIVSLLFACMFALLMSATTVEVVFDATVDLGNGSATAEPFMIEKDGVTLSISQGVANGSMPTGMADMDIRHKPKRNKGILN